MGLFKKFLRLNRRLDRKVRSALHLTSKNKLGRSLKHFQSLLRGNNSAATIQLPNGSYYSGSGYQYRGRSISQLTGGY